MSSTVPESSTEPALTWAGRSHPGRVRRENEDSWLAEAPLFVVADGMGGHGNGREAADAVIGAMRGGSWAAPVTWPEIEARLQVAATTVRALAERCDGTPGTTVTGVAVSEDEGRTAWLVFNIGDSRTYRYRDGDLAQLTVDHSRYQELLDEGWDADDAAARSPRNVITRAVGGGLTELPPADVWLLPAVAGDRILLCSDGLTNELTDAEISRVLLAHPDAALAAEQLVAAAVEAGGRDNVTVVLVDNLGATVTSRGSQPLISDVPVPTLEAQPTRYPSIDALFELTADEAAHD